MAGSGRDTLTVGWEGSELLSRGPGGVGSPSQTAGRGQEALPKVWEWLGGPPGGPERSGGPPRGPEGVGRHSRRAGSGREALPVRWQGSARV